MFLRRVVNPVSKFRCIGIPRQQTRSIITDEPPHGDPAAKITMLSQKMGSYIYISNYSPTGFTLRSGIKIVGPCAFFPKTVLQWNVASVADISEESLSLFTMMEPKIDILIIGAGSGEETLDPGIRKYLRSKNINLDLQNAAGACAAFNFLNSDGRYVAAAIIPPSHMRKPPHDPTYRHKEEMKEVYKGSPFSVD